MREEGVPHVLNWIALDMVRKSYFGPIEVGFFHELGTYVLRTGKGRR